MDGGRHSLAWRKKQNDACSVGAISSAGSADKEDVAPMFLQDAGIEAKGLVEDDFSEIDKEDENCKDG